MTALEKNNRLGGALILGVWPASELRPRIQRYPRELN